MLELGAGCGFTSIYLAKTMESEKVIITDLGSVTSVIKENIEINGCNTDQVQCKELFWGSQEHLDAVLGREEQTFDLVVGSDLLYDFEYFEELV